jgi:hypothetical protein
VQAVGELDQDHAHVARHGQQHLAEVLGLRLLEALVLDAVELGDAIDQVGGHLAEALGDLLLGDRRVFHHVVQQRGRQRLRVEMPAGQDFRHGERMGDVGFAADAHAGRGARRRRRRRIGGADAGDVFGLEVGGEQAVEAFQVLGEVDRRMHVRRNQRRLVGRPARCRGRWRQCREGVATVTFHPVRMVLSAAAVEDFEADLAGGDFAQGDDGRLVALRLDLRRAAQVSWRAR